MLGNNGPGIIADESATAVGGILIDGTGAVTGTGLDNSGILAEILNAANANDVTVSQSGNISGAFDGVLAQTDGDGNITVTTGASATITGTAYYGILALSYGSGTVSVSTTTDDTVDSGSAGIVAENWATPSEPSTLGSITVTADGTINSGTQTLPCSAMRRPEFSPATFRVAPAVPIRMLTAALSSLTMQTSLLRPAMASAPSITATATSR